MTEQRITPACLNFCKCWSRVIAPGLGCLVERELRQPRQVINEALTYEQAKHLGGRTPCQFAGYVVEVVVVKQLHHATVYNALKIAVIHHAAGSRVDAASHLYVQRVAPAMQIRALGGMVGNEVGGVEHHFLAYQDLRGITVEALRRSGHRPQSRLEDRKSTRLNS